ncbi:MAG: hypothetical protein KF855_03330 [Acidobacteria bacterium]|nr:hypothetical protein [Acidobacteriota bacterium]
MKTIRSKELVRELEQYSRTLRVFVRSNSKKQEFPISDVYLAGNAENMRVVVEVYTPAGAEDVLNGFYAVKTKTN